MSSNQMLVATRHNVADECHSSVLRVTHHISAD